MISAGVAVKALLMGTLVSLLAVTSFADSLILVLVSATATGIFGVLIVLIQTRSERNLHERINELEERQGSKLDEKAGEITSSIDAKAGEIVQAIEKPEPTP